jgi:hypothetical protein
MKENLFVLHVLMELMLLLKEVLIAFLAQLELIHYQGLLYVINVLLELTQIMALLIAFNFIYGEVDLIINI